MLERIKSGIPGMDEILNGGIPKGKNILLSGVAGTGKTIFASQFIAEGIKNKKPCVFVTFEQTKEKLKEDMKEIGIDFEEFEKTRLFKLIGGSITDVINFREMRRKNIIDNIKEDIEKINAERVVLDSINLFTMLFESDSEKRNALAELCSVLSKLGCTSILTCEMKEGANDISWYGFEEFVTDGAIVLFRKPIGNLFIRALAVAKMRGIAHSEFVYAIRIEKDGMKIYPTETLSKDFSIL